MANYWASLNSILANSHRLLRTLLNPLCLPEKLISKHASLKSEHEIYRSTQGLNPGSSDRPSRSMHTVSQPTEPPRQAVQSYHASIIIYTGDVLERFAACSMPWQLQTDVFVRIYFAYVMINFLKKKIRKTRPSVLMGEKGGKWRMDYVNGSDHKGVATHWKLGLQSLCVAQWPSGQDTGLAINRSRVQILASPLSSTTLGMLLTHMCLCHQPV